MDAFTKEFKQLVGESEEARKEHNRISKEIKEGKVSLGKRVRERRTRING
ncbi:hypothetical protein [Chengkuizengella axinellae]|uniref:Uncharacterized protein n=1 Tax=Chengkuizengella axinellae TaxID=3064388 RepID=A0ABT9J005_9BACL|nr:hypothetical protein [Chengkuizengella sp. 2205SS18-9]MDP5274335.1 hypothetical protein [Chengkuizengella sp. 2205SS18-9]